jgi:ribosome-binding factor A
MTINDAKQMTQCRAALMTFYFYLCTPVESTRQLKIARLLQKELATLFQKESRELAAGALITVTMVRVSPDLSVAKVYLSFYPVKDSKKFLENIKERVKEVRGKLGQAIKKQLRVVPELVFYIDDSLDYADNIDRLLKK